MNTIKKFEGSRRHVLDWVESLDFLDTIRNWVYGKGFTIPANAIWMPKSKAKPEESKLFDPNSPFLTESHKDELRRWWLVYSGTANIPNWDLIISAATITGKPALILVEAKAHVTEFDDQPKKRLVRDTDVAQQRTDANHERIGQAINEAARAQAVRHPGISISRDRCYQFSNRIAFAWKLASMGIPTMLIYLGFLGDTEIAKTDDYFENDVHWQKSFENHIDSLFPVNLIDQTIQCGKESFWLLIHSLPVKKPSSPLAERRR